MTLKRKNKKKEKIVNKNKGASSNEAPLFNNLNETKAEDAQLNGSNSVDEINDITIDTDEVPDSQIKATRYDYQLSRRLFHMSCGFIVASAYLFTLSHQRIIYFLGTTACVVYILDQMRISYPKLAKKFAKGTKYLLRAEEQLKESAAIPYVMATLLTILSFPKIIAVISIYTLAFADPLSALIGIKFGRHKIVKGKSLEGSLAFFMATFGSAIFVFYITGALNQSTIIVSAILGITGSIFEMMPIKLDDNLTIPLFSAFILRILFFIFSIQI